MPGGKEVVERMLSARRLTSLLSRSSTTTKAEVNGFGNRQKETQNFVNSPLEGTGFEPSVPLL